MFFGDIYRNLRSLFDTSAKAFNVTRTEWHILGKLYCRGPKLTQLELNNFLCLDEGQLTRALNSLEEKGYIRKTMDPHDKRIRHIELIDMRAKHICVMNQTNNEIEDTILSSLTEREQKTLFTLLERIKKITGELQIHPGEKKNARKS